MGLFLEFLTIFLLKLEVGHIGSPPVVTEEPAEVDLIEDITIKIMLGTGESCFENAVPSGEFEMHAIKVCADWMVPLSAACSTGEFHACLFQAEST